MHDKKINLKRVLRYVCAICAVPCIVFLRFVLMPFIGQGIPYITLFPVSVVVGLLAGFGPAILTGLLGSIATDYFFIPPLYTIDLSLEVVSRMIIVTFTSAFVGYVGARLRDARTKAEQQAAALHASEERFHKLFDDDLSGNFIAAPDGQIVVCNYAYVKIFGFANREDAVNSNLKDIHFDPQEFYKFITLIRENKGLHGYECFRRRRDGMKIHVVENIVGTFDEHGELLQFQGYILDDTERKSREGELQKLNRALTALSDSNQVMIRADEELAYLKDVCRIIEKDCGYAMVWIGIAENDENKTVRPVAFAGFEKGYLETLNISWADTERGRGPTGTAIRTGKVSMCKDMLNDPDFKPWRGEAIKRGYASSIVLPLITEKVAFGAITIYSKEPDAFSRDEEKLLVELANDLAYGITSLRMQTARHKAVRAIQASEERFKAIASNTPDHILVQDRDLRYSLVVNPQLGLTEKDMLGKTDYDILTKDDADNITKIKKQVIENDKPAHVEVPLIDHEGTQQFFDGTYIPSHDEQGCVIGLVGYFRNVTEQKSAEKTIRESEERLKKLYSSMNEGLANHEMIYEHGKAVDYIITEVNPAYESITGTARSFAIGKKASDLYGTIHPPYLEIYSEVASDGVPKYFETYFPPMDKHFSISVFSPEKGKFATVFTDITERKRTEEMLKKAHDELEQKVIERTAALVKSTDRLRFTMDNMNEGCMIIDAHWTYLYVNEAAARHGHQMREKLIGRTMPEMYPGIEETDVFANYWRAMIEHIPVQFESAFTFPDEITNWFEFSVEPVPEGIFVLSIDITERKRLTETLERNHRELLTFYRLSEIFLSSRSLEELFDDIVDEVCAATGFPIAGIGIYDGNNNRIIIRGQRSAAGQTARPILEIPMDGTLGGEVVRTGNPVIETHLLDRSKYQQIGLRQAQAQTFIGYPMKIGEKIIGCLNLLHTDNIKISNDLEQWIGSLANYVTVLIDRRRAEEELRMSREQLRELSKYTQSAIEVERKRIAREIHDELGQQLSLLQLELGVMENKLPRSEKDLRSKSKSMTKLIDASIRTVQRISTNLRPTLLDDLGLGAAVEWEVKEFQKRTKIKCLILVDPSDILLDQDRSIALFRILQETLTNILRHAKATKVEVQLTERDKTMTLKVRDNGIGISQQQINNTKSIGLTGMRERVRPWDGSVSITSQPGKETEVTVIIPTAP